MIHIGLFEGIGGFSLAAQWMGWETLVTCEINPFGQQILNYYWPGAYHHGDIHTLTYETINNQLSTRFGANWRNDDIILTGGFPCQPFSLAGKRLGNEDERHLWPEMLRVVREVSPRYIVGENVYGLINWDGGMVFDQVQADLEAEGYEVSPVILPAASVNAPHRRERVWFVAYNTNARFESMQPRRNNEIFRSELTPNTRLFRQKERHEQPMGTKQFCEEWNVTDPNGINRRAERAIGECGERETRHQPEWVCESEPTDTERKGLQISKQGKQPQQLFDVERNDSQNAASDTGCSFGKNGLHGKEQGRETTEFGDSYTKFGRWFKFPITEPTICRGNDGIPTEMVRQRIRADCMGLLSEKEIDKIISKAIVLHRNESIKAYGNAIVPQIALEIYKVIKSTRKE